jgi:hypothetical protein
MAGKPPKLWSEKRALLVIVLGIAAIAGVIYATQVKLADKNSTAATQVNQLQIAEMVLGTPSSPTQLKSKDPILKQAANYTTTDPLALRVTTTNLVTKPFQMNVRLLLPDGSIMPLDPPTATFQPGTSTYCCWLIKKPGNYTMQIFRPEHIVSTIALDIQASLQQQSGNFGQ